MNTGVNSTLPFLHTLPTLQVPGLADGWNDVKEKCTVVTEDFKVLILEQHAKKKAEHEDWLAVVKVKEGSGGMWLVCHMTKQREMKGGGAQDL